MLAKKASGRIDGFVVEGPTAGGHNAPPREAGNFNERGEPLYGNRDLADLEALGKLEMPFWMAGGYGTPRKLESAQAAGAHGVQVGTLFAFSRESGLTNEIKSAALERVQRGEADVFTDAKASPTGFPFKVVDLPKTLSRPDVYAKRQRICDLGYLRQAFRQEDGSIGFRCPAEPLANYTAKGGAPEETLGRKCLCNCLFASIGLGQTRDNDQREPPLVTAGDGLRDLQSFLAQASCDYSAAAVVEYLLKPSLS
jgi:NAD(P)H-dependent flavin oxidoreductase YrpB (nitropropane dioxygenase family)